jgi:hypothetical protein
MMLSMLLGGTAQSAVVEAGTITDSAIAPDDALASITFNADGTVDIVSFGMTEWTWKTGGSPASAYEIRSTITGGTPGSFTVDPSAGAWIDLGTNRTWTRERTGAEGVNSVIATFEIRGVTGTVLDSASITLEAETTPP